MSARQSKIAPTDLHDWLNAWVNAHDAGDMTDDETLAVFDFIAELRQWIDA